MIGNGSIEMNYIEKYSPALIGQDSIKVRRRWAPSPDGKNILIKCLHVEVKWKNKKKLDDPHRD